MKPDDLFMVSAGFCIKRRRSIIEKDYIKAHKFASNHRAELSKDSICGCFYCLKIFDPKEINFWIKDPGETAVCPYCSIDSVIGESSGYPIEREFLLQMKNHWF